VAEALLRSEVLPLVRDCMDLSGAGVYAIYYVGDYPAYRPIKIANGSRGYSQPIYVGKAVPKGARKGGLSFDAGIGSALRDRLRQHRSSIEQARNLDIDDFKYRALTVDDIWIPLGENMLIEKFQPLWNRVIDGFGNKDPGRRRATQYRSSWDVIHPGRDFAEKLATNPYLVESVILERVADFFAGRLSDREKLKLGEEESDEA
jgi:hypothetical protein